MLEERARQLRHHLWRFGWLSRFHHVLLLQVRPGQISRDFPRDAPLRDHARLHGAARAGEQGVRLVWKHHAPARPVLRGHRGVPVAVLLPRRLLALHGGYPGLSVPHPHLRKVPVPRALAPRLRRPGHLHRVHVAHPSRPHRHQKGHVHGGQRGGGQAPRRRRGGEREEGVRLAAEGVADARGHLDHGLAEQREPLPVHRPVVHLGRQGVERDGRDRKAEGKKQRPVCARTPSQGRPAAARGQPDCARGLEFAGSGPAVR
mmetsp:Transcript_15226/g.43686  ORF Transcript_15226/g.43686 Transcript_15226/m.43686 type:complete len:260 (+) Transcript_15226:241-1020(+)